MAKHEIKYTDIQWQNIDYSKVTIVSKICGAIKDHYWFNRPCGVSKSIPIESGDDYDFLIKAFETYHTEWGVRTKGCAKIGFYVAVPEEYKSENDKCFHLILDGRIPKDSAISHRFRKTDKKKADIAKCCRDAVMIEKRKLKLKYLNECAGANSVTPEDIHMHHSGMHFSDIVNSWINKKGGVDYLYQFVNTSINGGTITRFTSIEIINDFREFHKQYVHWEVLSKEDHQKTHAANRNKLKFTDYKNE